MPIPFIGPSYNLDSRTASVQRTVNMVPVPLEPGNETTKWAFKDIPGLTVFCAPTGEGRGGYLVNGRAFVVFGNTLYEVDATGALTTRGTLASSTGPVDMVAGPSQLAIQDGALYYVLDLTTNVMAVKPTGPTGPRIGFINQRVVGTTAGTQQFPWSDLGDIGTFDPLSFASAESTPDNLIGLIIDHEEVVLMGAKGGEFWVNVTSEEVFSKVPGGAFPVGLASAHSLQRFDNSFAWVGNDEAGTGSIWRMQGRTPILISTQREEQMLAGLDLSTARAYVYKSEKSTFYCLNVAGLDCTLVYDAFTGQWHDRAELVDGEYQPHRALFHLSAFGKHLVGAADGNLYLLDKTASNLNGDELVRDRISPHFRIPTGARASFNSFELLCDKGNGGVCQLRYSDDGGRNWGSWHQLSMGELGDFSVRVKKMRLGSARDRVWHVRCTDNVPFNPIEALIS